jgi:hypothetical protein
MRALLRRLLAPSTLVLGAIGCVETLHQSGREVASGAVQGSVEAAEDPTTRRAFSRLLEDPKVREALGSLSAEVAGEAVSGMTEPERIARLETVAQRLTAAVGVALAQSLDREVGPAIERVVVGAVARSLSESLGSATELRVEAISAAAARGVFRGMNDAFDDAKLGDAITPAGAIAREIGKQGTLGFQDAVRLESKKEQLSEAGDGEVLAAVGETADATLHAAPWIFWGLVALVLGTLGLSGYLLIQHRRDHRKARAVSDALGELDEGSSAAELRTRVRRALGEV